MSHAFDAVVVGAGPNGLAAAVVLARAGLRVQLLERDDTIGGGTRTKELTLPGFRHDVCSAVHPMAMASGFFRRWGLEQRVDMIVPEVSYGHPLDGGRAGVAHRDLERTVEGLGRDGATWRRMFSRLVDIEAELSQFTLSPILQLPRHPQTVVEFGLRILHQGGPWWDAGLRTEEARALLAGVMAHAIRPMPSLSAGAAGLALAVHGHGYGWAVPRGGSQVIADALADDLRAHGGVIETGVDVTSLRQLDARVKLLDVTPRQLIAIAGDEMPAGYRRRLERFRYGGGASKVDFALSGPVPWAAEELRRTPTVHLGGTRADIARAEHDVARGVHPAEPFVLAVQPGVVDDSRAPAGQHSLWTYAHVPNGSTVDMTEAITRQIERFAPGFRDLVLASSARSADELEAYNPNYVGGDIASGAPSLKQLIVRPVLSTDPWRTAVPGTYLASSSVPPGPSVHGMGGAYAAQSALRHEFGIDHLPRLGPDGGSDS
ncbi:NAD(P)/FAD-dependent oxidoreductase [Frigoribacterium sp. CFBP 8754]|uniref:phytoene desaturase family protein n=1 Tax=Frigoribacterium sp. CFBP 8754 TaxID=2775290 RepID=UPI00178518E3|nr:NAD(P)/FAD-dependent oxidoreductase [Frigoribacterium sp. CFBP 8754]MBD8660085.1 NAD(P)/FAD-dependent oxidoreductase [Frigoribacterium sp. CFBP 8754]